MDSFDTSFETDVNELCVWEMENPGQLLGVWLKLLCGCYYQVLTQG